MALQPGTRLGVYEVADQIGAGGMGAVYRARDTRLNRDVALKILPTEFALDAHRIARFKREAQVLASLNHPAHRPDLRPPFPAASHEIRISPGERTYPQWSANGREILF